MFLYGSLALFDILFTSRSLLDLGWWFSGIVGAACFSMNLYVIWQDRCNELLVLARDVKKARLVKELREIETSMAMNRVAVR